MCLGVPGRVIEVHDCTATVDFWGVRKEVRLDIVDEPVAPGDYILNHVGFAIRRIPAESVGETLALYEMLLREGEGADDLMTSDVRAEIAGTKVTNDLQFRDPVLARSLAATLVRLMDEIGRPVAVMHVCGSHEQAIARFGLRSLFPKSLDVIMGPGCPVCVTDVPEVDEGVVLARQGVRVATFGDMLRVPGTVQSLADAQASGAKIDIVYSPRQAAEIARNTDEEVVLFASGFETTAVATAAVILDDPPPNFSVLSAHKYIPPVMEIVAEMPGSRVEGFLAAGHAATITGSAVFEPFVERHKVPVVVAGFEPIDILAGLVELLDLIRNRTPRVVNMFHRCVTAEGNLAAQKQLWRVFESTGGRWRGIAHVPNGNLRLRDEFAYIDARKRFTIDLPSLWDYAPPALAGQCICGEIMSGIRNPRDCQLFNRECVPETPVGACMVSNEGTCKIWHLYGGVPDLEATA